jgi:transcriptional regulator with XRE-family HTH domain
LRQVSNEIEKHGEWLPPSTLSRIERGKLDPSVRRLFLLLDLYRVSAIDVADLVRSAEPCPGSGSVAT